MPSLFETILLPEAEEDLERLDPPVRSRCLDKIEWLSEHPELLGKKPLQNLPLPLRGLCSYAVGDWRVLYWVHPERKLLKIYGVQHRSKVYKRF